MTVPVEHAHYGLIVWCDQGEQYNAIHIAWPGCLDEILIKFYRHLHTIT